MLIGSISPDYRNAHGSPARIAARGSVRGAALFLTTYLLAVAPARAEVALDGLFSRSAVLQQGMPVPVFGTAEDGERVSVTIQNRRAETVAKDGRWRVELEPLEAGGPFELRIGGATSITVPEIYVGEVWVCAGQANMQWNVFNSKGSASALISPSNRELHFYTVERKATTEPKSDNTPNWSAANAATIANFSAVGYYFGREIQIQRKVPVGLINCSHFLSNAEAWTDRESIAVQPSLKRIVDDVLPDREDVQTPGTLFNGMVEPIAQYAVRGVVFYQGENNVDHADEYQRLLTTLIGDWRRAWNKPELPFLFVQIAPYRPVTSSTESKFAALREAQLRTWQSVPHTAMVVTTDYGDARTLQPVDKEPVGRRLALGARAMAYGEKVEYSGPVYRSHKTMKNQLILEFDHVGEGLQAGPPAVAAALGSATKSAAAKPASSTLKSVKLLGFTVAGSDGVFVPADATIEEGNKIALSAEAVAMPIAARYGWADFPICNLYNRNGLPASPFRTNTPADVTDVIRSLFQK